MGATVGPPAADEVAPPLLGARPAVLAGRLLATRSPATIRRVLGIARRGAQPASYGVAAGAQAALIRVSPRLGAHDACLVRSIASALLCRLHGVWPSWCVGVAGEPFAAHAWIEAEGRPVAERVDLAEYSSLIRVAPPGIGG